jgi:hypothetical protein
MPLLVKDQDFETELCDYVERRRYTASAGFSDQDRQTQELQRGMSMAWVSTLLALLACGAQFGNETISTRQEQSSLYGKWI